MNMMILCENTAVATAAASACAISAGQERRLVPLSLFRPSSRNVRRGVFVADFIIRRIVAWQVSRPMQTAWQPAPSAGS